MMKCSIRLWESPPTKAVYVSFGLTIQANVVFYRKAWRKRGDQESTVSAIYISVV